MSTSKLNFEQAIEELENLITQMEKGDISLEQALSHFERGVSLARHSHDLLSKAEQRVKILSEKNGEGSLVDFNPPDSDS